MSKIIDKNISRDLSKHLIKSIILSVFMAISVFMFVMHSDSFLMDISYEYYNYKDEKLRQFLNAEFVSPKLNPDAIKLDNGFYVTLGNNRDS